MRLIDADALKKKVRNECLMPDWCHVLIDVAIADMPTIEVRKKGEWIGDSGPIACSVCHIIWLYRRTNYCPNCGADMKGENNGE